ncbi:MAG: hypothetical protein J5I91_07130 [Bacteroidetes bacterium]|nr:hypothetical protein [Bacteroidota bacterium]
MSSIVFRYNKADGLNINIDIPLSKSIYNRLLVLKKLYFPNLILKTEPDSNDSRLMERLLSQDYNNTILDAEDAGTVFRFMTAVLASTDSDCILSGSNRMKERPVGGLVTMLRKTGASINYMGKEGFPPIKIIGKVKEGGITIDSDDIQSSQFYSAMAMVAPSFRKGLTLVVPQQLGSYSYWEITLQCMKQLNIPWEIQGEQHYFFPHFESESTFKHLEVEKDWSAASFFILLPLLFDKLTISLRGLRLNSIQGDAKFFTHNASALGLEFSQTQFGVTVTNNKQGVRISQLDFTDSPDLSLNFIAVLALLKKKFSFSGLESLALKESNRTLALQNELKKANISFACKGNLWELDSSQMAIPEFIEFDTYKDHRIAMALSYFGFFTQIKINESEVVSKSFPDFFKELSKFGIKTSK